MPLTERNHLGAKDSDPKFLVVDGSAVAYRAYFALPHLTAPSGEPTNAIYGFIRMVNKLLTDLKPAFGVVVWDGGRSTDRLQIHPEYKATRPPMPDELRSQIRRIQEFLDYSGIRSVQIEGVEADDLVATFAKVGVNSGLVIYIVGNDKDFCQLVSDRVFVVSPTHRKPELLTIARVHEKFGVFPDQVIDYLSLVGDSVDNIEGVPGVGPKTAAQLLEKFGTIEELYCRLSEVQPERLRNALREHEYQVKRNKELISFKIFPDIVGELKNYALQQQNNEKLRGFYRELGFNSLIKEIDESISKAEVGELFQ
jgi:DNA polymerase-1